MKKLWSRRELWRVGVPVSVAALFGARVARSESSSAVPAAFPAQDPARVREIVGASHANLDRVRELLAESPALAKAAYDWGFGDWETAIGAASHTGRRDIVEVLMAHGARPDLFTQAMLGDLAAVKAAVASMPGVERIAGPHGITLLAHARAGGDAAKAVAVWLEELGTADPAASSQPLPAAQAAYFGVYGYGAAADERFEIVDQRGQLGLRRGEGFARGLFHLGESTFHPVGSPAVRIRFTLGEHGATQAEVVDGPLRVVAHRLPG